MTSVAASYNLLRSAPSDPVDNNVIFSPIQPENSLVIDDEYRKVSSTEGEIEPTAESAILNKATWGSAYINLTSTVIGAGILGLPHAFSATGWIGGSILLLGCACSSAFALHFLSKCAKKVESPVSFYSISQLAVPGYSFLIDLAVAIKCYGVATSYLVVIGDLMPAAMEQLHAGAMWRQRSLWIGIGFLIVAPLSCLQSLDALKYTSSLSVIFILFLVFIILLFALPSLTGLNPCLDYGVNEICKGETEYSRFDSGSLKALSVFVFGYTCQQNLFSIINELKSPTQERVDLVIVSSIGSAFVLFMIVGYCGYSTYGNNVASDLLKSYPEIPLTTAARICVSFIVSFAYPLQANPSRRSLLTLWKTACGGGEPSILNYNLRYYTITITFLITSLFIAITVHDLGIVLAFVGATGSTIVSYILPGIFYYKIFRNDELEPKWKTKLSLLQFTLGLIIIPVCLYFLIFVQ